MSSLSRQLAALSATEVVNSLGAGQAPLRLRQALALPFFALSRRLGNTLAAMDEAISTRGLPAAAAGALTELRVALRTSGRAPAAACLVLANHPGAYDALAVVSALERPDLLILAADRSFLRALPQLSQHLVFVGQRPGERAAALKRAVSCLRGGGAVLHFPAGEIEPDADFEPQDARWLKPWQPGAGVLLRACAKVGGRVVLAGVRGVHSPSAKRLLINRWAERRGVTTVAPLLQMAGKLRDVVVKVRCVDAGSASELLDADAEARLRKRLREAIRQA